MRILHVDTEGSYSYAITNEAIKKYLSKINGVHYKLANHKRTEIHHLDGFIPDWCLTSSPLNNHSYVIKQHRKWFSVGWDLEGCYEWKRLRDTDSPNFDVIATVDPIAVGLLSERGKTSLYLPLGFDPDIYHYQQVPEEYKSDVIIAGVMYDSRAQWVRELEPIAKHIKIRTINCKHWEAKLIHCKRFIHYYHNDLVPISELVKYYCGAKIILIGHRNYAPGNDKTKEVIPAAIGRVFQETACRRMVLSDDTRPNLAHHFEYGKEIEIFKDGEELREKIMYYLEHDDERESIAHLGCVRTMSENTYTHRLNNLIEFVKNILIGGFE